MLGHVLAQLLEIAGITVRVGLAGHEVNQSLLLDGQIDLYADYLGTAVRRYLKLTPPKTADETYRVVRDEARKRWGLEWLPAFGFNNTYAVVIRRTLAYRLGANGIDDLLPDAADLRLGGIADFLRTESPITFAPGGYDGLRAAYGLEFGRTIELPAQYGATFEALEDGEVDAIVDFPVNPRMVSMDLVELTDTRHFFAPYFAAPVARAEFLAVQPDARSILELLAGRIDNRRAAYMNYAVEMREQDPLDVAAELVREISADLTVADRARRASRRLVD